MSTPVSGSTRSERTLRQVLARHNETKFNSLNSHDRFVAKTMINFPPVACTVCSHNGDQAANSAISDPKVFEGNINSGQQLFDQLIQCERKRDRLLVPDLATEWFRKQKVFLDRIPQGVQAGNENETMPFTSNSQKADSSGLSKQYSEQYRAWRQDLKKRKLSLHTKCTCCTWEPSNRDQQPLKKKLNGWPSSSAEQGETIKEQQQTQEEKNVKRSPIGMCKSHISDSGGGTGEAPSEKVDTSSLSKRNRQLLGEIKLPLRRRCPCRPQACRKRNSYSCMFQADGQPMSGDCLAARRTEPLLPRLRKKYDLRKAPQRRLDPTHFRRISPEFYSLLKRYEDGMTQRYPLYGISMRYWNETRPYCPCEKRRKPINDHYLGDEAVQSPPEKPKKLNPAPSLETVKEKSPEETDSPQDTQATTAQVPCTNKTCPNLNQRKPAPNRCQYCNSCIIQPTKQDKDKAACEKLKSSICCCFRPRQPPETEISGNDSKKDLKTTTNSSKSSTFHRTPALTAYSGIPRWVAPSGPVHGAALPPPNSQSFSTSQGVDDSIISASQDAMSHEQAPSPPEPRHRTTGFIGDFACMCKRALLPGRHLLYHFNNKYRQHREDYADRHGTAKSTVMKRHSKFPNHRCQDIQNGPPSLFETQPAPCRWHLNEGPDLSNSNVTLKPNHSFQAVGESNCQVTVAPTPELCSCSSETPSHVATQDTTKSSKLELTITSIQGSGHMDPNLNIAQDTTGPDEDPKSQSDALTNSSQDSSITIKYCEPPPARRPQIESTRHYVLCTNDKCIQSNSEDLSKIRKFICVNSLQCDSKPRTRKKKGQPCAVPKHPCTRACFLASDYLQLMHRVARKRASNIISPKRKSARSKSRSREPSPHQNKQNIMASAQQTKTISCRQSRKPPPQCPGQHSQKGSEEDSQPGNSTQLGESASQDLSRSHSEETNCYTDSYCDSYSHRKTSQHPNGISLASGFVDSQCCSPCWINQSRSTDTHLRSEQTFSSSNRHLDPPSPCCYKRSSTSSSRDTSSGSFSRSSSSVYGDKAHVPGQTQDYSCTWPFPVTQIKREPDGINAKEPEMQARWIKHSQYANAFPPSWSNNPSLGTSASMQSKSDPNYVNYTNLIPHDDEACCKRIPESDTSKVFVAKSSLNSGQKDPQCYWEETRHRTQLKPPGAQKRARFAIGHLGYSRGLRHAVSSHTSSIYWPCVPAPSVASISPGQLDLGRISRPLSKDNHNSVHSRQSANRCCYLTQTDPSSHQQEQNNCMQTSSDRQSPSQYRIPNARCSRTKLISHKPATNEEYTRKQTASEKKTKHHYNHNRAHLLLCSRRPPPPQSKTFPHSHCGQHENCGIRRGPTYNSREQQFVDVKDEDAHMTEMQCHQRNDCNILCFTHRSNSGCDPPVRREGREQTVLSNNQQRPHCYGTRSADPDSSLKQKESVSSGSSGSSARPEGVENEEEWYNCADEDPLPRSTNDKRYLEQRDRGNALQSNAESSSSQNSRLTSLTSEFAGPTMKCFGKDSSHAAPQNRCFNRSFLQPVSVVSDLDFYTHSTGNVQAPPVQPRSRQGQNPPHTYARAPTALSNFLDNLRSKNISVFTFPSPSGNAAPNAMAGNRRYYSSSSSSDTDDPDRHRSQRLGESCGYTVTRRPPQASTKLL